MELGEAITNRVIPTLLIDGEGFVKTVKFKNRVYLGDPVNIVRIFNEKEADELVLLDINATAEGRGPDFDFIKDIASECFMPIAYGGGVTSLEDYDRLFDVGVEIVIVNTAGINNPELVAAAASKYGNQSVVACIDYKSGLLGVKVYSECGKKKTQHTPVELAQAYESLGVGEIFIQSIDNDGSMQGYDLEMIKKVADSVDVPVVGCGGAGSIEDHKKIIELGASASAAGAMFVFKGKHRAVLVSYPTNHSF